MAIDLVNAGTYEASAASIWYPNYPASVDTGQALVMQLTVRDTATTPTVSASWILMYGPDSNLTSRQFLYFRFGTTTMAGSSTTARGGVTTVTKQGRIYGFSGVSVTATAFEAGAHMTSNTTSMTCGEVTSTVASFTTLGIAAYHVADDNDVGTFAGMIGATWAKKYQASTTLGSDGTIGIQVCTITAIATVTTASYSMAAADPWGVRTFLLIGSATVAAGPTMPVFMHDYFRLWAG